MTDPPRNIGHRPAPSDAVPVADIDEQIEQVLAGDRRAWDSLMGHCHALALAVCARRRLGAAMPGRDDLYRDVAGRTLERLAAADFAALRSYIDCRHRYPATRFHHWLAAVVSNVFIDRVRAVPEVQRRRAGVGRSVERIDVRQLDGPAVDATAIDPDTAVEVRRILAVVAEPDFPRPQRRALHLWLLGHNPAEIAATLGLDNSADASRLLNAARARLRRKFRC